MMAEPQKPTSAMRFYETKSWEYDSTWHTDFTKRFISHLDIQPGQSVLDLACGTGLLTFLESEAVGPTGEVIGVDVTPAMLALAKRKKEVAGEKYKNVELYEGDISRLNEVDALKGKTFDVVTVASALAWFPEPKSAIEHWAEYLKPGGIIAMDITHPRNLVSGIVLERVARRLELPIQNNRVWSKSETTLKNMLHSAGLEVDSVTTIHNQAGYGTRYHDVDAWDDFFVENVIVKDVMRVFSNNDIRRKAQGIYKEEWEKIAIDGKVEEVDAVFLGIGRKPADGSRYTPKVFENEVVFRGGCRCGEVQYTASQPPSDITICHCRACQQLSGSGFLPFVDIPKDSMTYTKSATLKSMRLTDVAERTLCSGCGTPMTMEYWHDKGTISVTMSSVDPNSFLCEPPRVASHIFLREKAFWVKLPDDDAERWSTHENAHKYYVNN